MYAQNPDNPTQPDPNNTPFPPNVNGNTPPVDSPYTADDEAAARQYFFDYMSKHHILNQWGTVDDAFRAYMQQRQSGVAHADALTGALHTLGWDHNLPDGTDAGTTGNSGAGTGTTGQLGSLLQPFDEKFSPAPSPAAFQFPDFQLPTGQEVLDQDPGYQFRVNQGMQALTNSAAAKHQLRTGATLKNFLDFGQQLGSQEYGNAADRLFNVYTANRGNQLGIYNAGVDKAKLDWQHGFDTWNQDFNIFKWNKTFPYTVLHDQQQLGVDAASRA
jgi:hypothetical protein